MRYTAATTPEELMHPSPEQEAISVRFPLGRSRWIDVRVDEQGVAHISASGRFNIAPNAANSISVTIETF